MKISALLLSVALAAPAVSLAQAAHPALDLTPVKPESVGFSSERLDNLHALIQGEIDHHQLAGAITLLASRQNRRLPHLRHARPRHFYAHHEGHHLPRLLHDQAGHRRRDDDPLRTGQMAPTDPIAKYIPEFAHLKVFNGVDNDGKMILVDPDHAPTMRELMSHSAGFSYGSGNTVVDALYKDLKPMQSANLQEMIDKLAKIPLNYQPGKGWTYSLSMDIEGYLVEKLSGQSLPAFMHDHIFTPLGMADAGFYVPADKRSRFATGYTANAQGGLVAAESGPPTDYAVEPTLASGGGGLVSTIEDYYRFAQMLGNGGQLNGTRVLSPPTVKLMTSNHLPKEILTGQFGIGQHIMRPGFGYGFNCAVVFDPPEANLSDGKGTFFWDGAAGTWFWVDPTNDIVFVGMIQRRGGSDNHAMLYRTHATVYSALVDPSK